MFPYSPVENPATSLLADGGLGQVGVSVGPGGVHTVLDSLSRFRPRSLRHLSSLSLSGDDFGAACHWLGMGSLVTTFFDNLLLSVSPASRALPGPGPVSPRAPPSAVCIFTVLY